MLLAAMIGGDTLTDSGRLARPTECEGGVAARRAFADLRDVGALLQRAGFALPVTDVDRVVVLRQRLRADTDLKRWARPTS